MRSRSRWVYRAGLLTLLTILAITLMGGSAFAARYAGNSRNPGYGVKADISTPSSMPIVTDGLVFNMVTNMDAGEWIQVGWVQGNGTIKAPDGTYWPTVPTSYEEVYVNGVYDLYLYSAQPLSFTRTYEVVHTGYSIWQGIIAGTRRYSAGPFATPTEVQALTEIVGSTSTQTRAAFNNVQYRGLYSYMPFDQYNWWTDNPPYATFYSNSKYTCYNGM